MYIIFGQEAADKLKETYTLLPLEELPVKDKLVRAYCVVPADKLSVADLASLDLDIELHNKFISAWEAKNYKYCENAADLLKGKFGGEVDSFYDELIKRVAVNSNN